MRTGWLWIVVGLTGMAGCKDTDNDGVRDGRDCAPGDYFVNPDAQEVCDGIDNNCNGQVDEGVSIVAFWDRDRDGFGDPTFARRVCALPEDGASEAGDCNDLDPKVGPGAAELCDLIDNDCDGEIDEGVLLTFYKDDDGDGHGVVGETALACFAPPGFAPAADDCDDDEPAAWTDAGEVCDGIDNNCDGEVDEGLEPTRQWTDADGDGYGDPAAPVLACGPGPGVANNDLDCNDNDASWGPHANDIRNNGLNEDCDAYIDEFGVGPTQEFATIEDALLSAPNGAVVQLDDGFHVGTIDLRGEDITLAGEGCARTTLYGDAQGTVIIADAGRIENLTVSGGTGLVVDVSNADLVGGGIQIRGNVTIKDACIVANSATRGGGIAVLEGTATLVNVEVANNTASSNGAGIYVRPPGLLDLRQSRVVGNVAGGRGGGITVSGTAATIVNTVIAGNNCLTYGGGLHADLYTDPLTATVTASTVVVGHSTFHRNQSTLTPTNTGRNGEAIRLEGGTASISNSLFTGHPLPYTVLESVTGSDLSPGLYTKSFLGYRGNAGPDADYEAYQPDRIAADVTYVQDDPTLPARQWDLRFAPGTGFVDQADPASQDPDGSAGDLGAFGGPGAPEGWDFGFVVDEDGDGLLDAWELRYGTNRWVDDAGDDDDGDGLSNLEEQGLGTDPRARDTDGDGVIDGNEVGMGMSPLLARDQAPLVQVAASRRGLVNEPVPLDASGTQDPNNDALTYAWALTTVPATSQAVVAQAGIAATTFTPDIAGTYVAMVTVADGGTERTAQVTIIVHSGVIVPDNYATVQAAVDASGTGAVGVRAGTWFGAVETIGRNVVIIGLGETAEDVVLDAGGVGSVVEVDGGTLVVAHASLIGGYAHQGGGVYANLANLTLLDVVIRDNLAFDGGGVWANHPNEVLTATDVRFVNNTAQHHGGGLWHTGENVKRTLEARTLWFSGNRADRGAGMWLDGGILTGVDADFHVYGVTFMDNTARDSGAAWVHTGQGSDLVVENASFAFNRGYALGTSAQGRNQLFSDAVAYNDVTHLWDGTGVEWQHFDGVWRDLPAEPWYADAGLVGTLATWIAEDPRLGPLTNDGDLADDHPGLRLGSVASDKGFLDHLDRDGSRADVGACGGRYAPVRCAHAWLDRDADGMSDTWEALVGLDPTVPDANLDPDGDGLINFAEHEAGTHPGRADSDRDGVNDNVELGAGDQPINDRDHRPQAVVPDSTRVERGDSAILSGLLSYDPDAQPIESYSWRLIGGPAASVVTQADLVGADTPTLTFVPDAGGAFRLGLTVTAGGATSRETTTWVTVPRDFLIPEDYATIAEAFAEAGPGDTLRIGAGTYAVNLAPGVLPISIIGAGQDVTFLEPTFEGDSMIDLSQGGNVAVRDLTFVGGSSQQGGAIDCDGARVSLTRVKGLRNVANSGGFLRAYDCDTVMTDVTMVENQAGSSGGAMYAQLGTLTFIRGTVAYNSSGLTGGAFQLKSVDTVMRNVHIHRNRAESSGAGIYMDFTNAVGQLDLEYLTITGNEGLFGTIHRIGQIPLTVRHSIIAASTGWGLYDAGLAVNLFVDTNLWSANQLHSFPSAASNGPTDLKLNPAFVSFDEFKTGLIADDVHLRHNSPARNVGGHLDPDGSVSDFGVYGGPDAAVGWDVYFRDTDSDGMADGWEEEMGLDPLTDDAAFDPDADGLLNAIEFSIGADPFLVDTDADGVDDPTEFGLATNPADPIDFAPSANAGLDAVVDVGNMAVLTGTGVDPQLDPVFFAWKLIEKPGRSILTTGDLAGADTASVSFVPDTPGRFVLSLVTSDGVGFSLLDTVHVGVPGDVLIPADYLTLAAAVDAVQAGATLFVDPGTYPARLELFGKDLSIVGAGLDLTVFDAEDRGAILVARDNEVVTLEGLTLTNGRSARGGALWFDGVDATLTDVSLENNIGAEGGAIYAASSDIYATGLRVVDNFAGYRSGGLMGTSTTLFDVAQALFANNAAPKSQGGAIRSFGGTVNVTNAVFSGNQANEGGGIFLTGNNIVGNLSHITAVHNSAVSQGSFLRINDTAVVTLTDSIVTQNRGAAAISETSTIGSLTQTYTLVAGNDIDYLLAITPAFVDGVDGNDLDGDPDLVDVTEDGDWTNDDFTLGPVSDARDTADPLGTPDVDLSLPDMGAFGGAFGGFLP